MEKPNIISGKLLWVLSCSLISVVWPLDAAAPVALERSLLPLYEDIDVSVPQGACRTCVIRKCHKNHTFCPVCEHKCKECPPNCADCQSTCSVCLEQLSKVKAVVLKCDHSFCEKCIRDWQGAVRKSQLQSEGAKFTDSCPNCRSPIDFKLCALCHTSVYDWEPSCSYTCIHRNWDWCSEEHIFHRRCIEPFVRKSAFIAEEDIRNVTQLGVTMRILKGEAAFHCPVKHRNATKTVIDLKIPLLKVLSAAQYLGKAFPYKKKSSETSKCDVCHQQILPTQEKSSYSCEYRDLIWRKQEHVCHTSCLKPLAQRTAYVQTRNGIPTGKTVFHCPLDHDHDVWYSMPSLNTDLEVEMPRGFISETVRHVCPCCKEDVDTQKKETYTVAAYKGYPGLLCLLVDETIYFHTKCFGALVAKTARLKSEGFWNSTVKAVYPCPCHEGTKWAHDIELPDATAVVDLKPA